MSYSTIKQTIQTNVYDNTNQEIGGNKLRDVLLAMVDAIVGSGYVFGGVATSSTSFGSPEQRTFWIAQDAFTHSTLGDIKAGDIILWDGTSLSLKAMDLGGVFIAHYYGEDSEDNTTWDEMETAVDEGKAVILRDDENLGEYSYAMMVHFDPTNYCRFTRVKDGVQNTYELTNMNDWNESSIEFQRTSNKRLSLSENSDIYYPSQKAVKTVTDALDTRITNLSTIGRFLSTWNAVTGLPFTNPTESPYAYKKGDYYIVGVGVVSGKKVTIDGVVYYPSTVVTGSAQNMRRYVSRTGTGYFCNKDVTPTTSTPFYTEPSTSGTAVYPSAVADTGSDALIPSGTSYTSGVASTTAATPPINVNDMYVYDGQGSWIRIDNGAKAISWGSIEGTLSNQTDLAAALAAADKVFIATYGTTSYADVLAAYNAGKAILGKKVVGENDNEHYLMVAWDDNSEKFQFWALDSITAKGMTLDSTGWDSDTIQLEDTSNRQNAITDSDNHYPSSGAVVDFVKPTIQTPASASSYTIAPDVLTQLGTLTGAITIALQATSDSRQHCYAFTFTADSTTAPTFTWPSGISWMGGSAPTITAGKTYEVSIMSNLAVIGEF